MATRRAVPGSVRQDRFQHTHVCDNSFVRTCALRPPDMLVAGLTRQHQRAVGGKRSATTGPRHLRARYVTAATAQKNSLDACQGATSFAPNSALHKWRHRCSGTQQRRRRRAKLVRVHAGEDRTAARAAARGGLGLAELELAPGLTRRPSAPLAGDAMSAAVVVVGLITHAAPLNACPKAYAGVRASQHCSGAKGRLLPARRHRDGNGQCQPATTFCEVVAPAAVVISHPGSFALAASA
jgi:hypothetical protein